MTPYDLILTASCYFSPPHSIRLIRSMPVIQGKTLAVITCPHREEAEMIATAVQDGPADVAILHSERKERHLCQDLGLVWCMANKLSSRYVAFTDDDIEFTCPSILGYLAAAPEFSVLGFTSNTMHYGFKPFQGTHQSGDYAFDPIWIDGNNLFTKWETNMKAGIMDATPGSYNVSSAEVEYAQRLSLITGYPTIGCRHYGLHHHSRIDNVEQLRDATNQQNVIGEGYKFWKQKFGLSLSGADFNSGKIGWKDVEKTLKQPQYNSLYKRHIIFDGLWLEWDKIWNNYSSGISIVYTNIFK